MKNYYEILELPIKSSVQDVKRQYLKLSMKYHPDVCKEENSAQRFIDIHEAYDYLSDVTKKHFYDMRISKITPEQLVRKLILKMK
jgi:molecular chaperone DnaJ